MRWGPKLYIRPNFLQFHKQLPIIVMRTLNRGIFLYLLTCEDRKKYFLGLVSVNFYLNVALCEWKEPCRVYDEITTRIKAIKVVCHKYNTRKSWICIYKSQKFLETVLDGGLFMPVPKWCIVWKRIACTRVSVFSALQLCIRV